MAEKKIIQRSAEFYIVQPKSKVMFSEKHTDDYEIQATILKNCLFWAEALNTKETREYVIAYFKNLKTLYEQQSPKSIIELNIDGFSPVVQNHEYILGNGMSKIYMSRIMFRDQSIISNYLKLNSGKDVSIIRPLYENRIPSVKTDENFDINSIPIINHSGIEGFLRLYQTKKK